MKTNVTFLQRPSSRDRMPAADMNRERRSMEMSSPKYIAVLVLLASLQGIGHAQGGAEGRADRLTFDVVSIKPADPGAGSVVFKPQRGRFAASAATIVDLIVFAYEVPRHRIVNMPTGRTERFDIIATTSMPDVNVQREMLRAALEERFSLRARKAIQVMPVYDLVRSRSDGSLGPRIKPSSVECGTTATAGSVACYLSIQPGEIKAVGRDWQQMALYRQLQPVIEESIVDKTGLSGRFDLDLNWTNDLEAKAGSVDGVSIFTALDEQLGLRLVRSNGPVEVVVVESVGAPRLN